MHVQGTCAQWQPQTLEALNLEPSQNFEWHVHLKDGTRHRFFCDES